MEKFKKLEQLQKLKENGSLTEEEFNIEKERLLKGQEKTKNSKVGIVILLVILLIIGGVCIYYYMNKETEIETETTTNISSEDDMKEGFEETSANVSVNGTDNVSFVNMSGDDEDLTDEQKEIINYFDNNYFSFLSTETLQRYPQVFKNAKVCAGFGIKKVLKSTDSEFEALVYAETSGFPDDIYENVSISEIPSDVLFVIKGSQMEERLLENDHATVYGRYVNVESYEIDGVTYTLPTVNMISITQEDEGSRYNINTITTVAKSIFGNNIKVSSLGNDEYLEMETHLSRGMQSSGYRVTLDNQSNANFKSFVMDDDTGLISYDWKTSDVSDKVTKKLFVAADFQHYIVTTYDADLRHVYIEYFDNQYNKLWSREFDYNSTKAFASPLDYTDTQMAVVVDNDLYLIDLETGENVIEPILVGDKLKINMMSDGIVLIADDNKDTIMKVGYDGMILFKVNGNLQLDTVKYVYTQIVDSKLVVSLYGLTSEELSRSQYLVINNDGTLEVSTNIS